ncbi:MAG TPA: zinc metallopeptidase [Gemmataceae bacterium]|nr:zinc metallopeptidase [Gemmataceae bacterium]
MWLNFDPIYFVFLAPAMLLALWAQFRVRSTFHAASQIPSDGGLSGAQAAYQLLRYAGIQGVEIEPAQGFLSDHYVPGQKLLRLSPDVYGGRSLAAVGVAAHECGHAMQDAKRYPLLGLRNFLVPVASIGSNLAWVILLAGFLFSLLPLIYAGIIAFSTTVAFQLVNLPVEFDASRRARAALRNAGLVSYEEDREIKKVLGAAALTYVAATLTSVLTLLYFLLRSGLLGSRRSA